MFAKKSISHIFSVLFIIVFILAVTPLQAAHAAGIRYAKPAASGTGDCSSWANACTLQTALTGAVSDDEIWAAAGTYTPGTLRIDTFQLIDGVALYGGFAGTEIARDLRNPAVNVTTLSGDLNGDDDGFYYMFENVYHVVTGATGATLDGFTITAGNANTNTLEGCPGKYCGGGMLNNASNPTLTNVTFSGNSAGYGGGMYNWSSSPTLTDVTFNGNTAETNGGGMLNSDINPTLTNVTFTGNTAVRKGGGMLNYASSPTLTNVTFIGNSAEVGGGMNNMNSSPTLTNVTFSGNKATLFGGGIFNITSSNPMLTNVTFTANSTGWGGGMFNDTSSNPILTNVTFNSNTATNDGGGMYNNTGTNPMLTNVTFSGNSAKYGGGMDNSSSNPTIRNTIFWSNTASSSGAQIYNNGGSPIVSDSVVQDGCPAGSTCPNIITADPKLGTLGNYGGFTQTIPLQAGSSAIDMGNDAVCPATDQRGVSRPQGAHCDIGAYEYLDTIAPTVNTFTVITPSNSLNIPITAFNATDDVIVTGYLITTSSTPPAAEAAGWTGTAPVTYTVASDGSYTLYPWAKDAAGNISAIFASPGAVVVDTNAPDTQINSHPANQSNSANASFTFSSPDGTAMFECSLGGGPYKACTSPKNYTGLVAGSHTFAVRAKDPAGNVDATPASYTWVIDLTAPMVVSSLRADASPTSAASVNFIVTFSESVTGVDEINFSLTTMGVSGASVTGVSGSGSIYTVTVNTGSDNGTIHLDVTTSPIITDLAGNPLAGLPYTGGETYTITKLFTIFLPLILR
ncbi:MAG: right-handed parallel beta-helix repeat-containing protein [Chloroflexi bacterium]|nr:right-handed parallel beta-helix repeat-containing protein [Chloroflexota bacterium]